MKIILWRFSENTEEQMNILCKNSYFLEYEDVNYTQYYPDIDLEFYRIFTCFDNDYTYLILDIYQVVPDMPNKNYIFPLIRQVYLNEKRMGTKKMSNMQKKISENTTTFKDKKFQDLYLHQIENIAWMTQLEKGDSFDLLKNNHMMITENVAINLSTFELVWKEDACEKIKIPGGCLLDDYGMGKTKSMIHLCEQNKDKDMIHVYDRGTTLIICEHDLCLKWVEEILECNPCARIKLLATPVNFTSFDLDLDYVVMSFKFYNDYHRKTYQQFNFNNNHIDSIKFMKKHARTNHLECNQITNFRWKRLIIDDIHEIFRLKQNDYFLNCIHQIEARYRWGIAGQQIFHTDMLTNVMKFIMGTNDIEHYIYQDIFINKLYYHFKKTIFNNQYLFHKILLFNKVEANGYLKQRNSHDKQHFCLFPEMKVHSINEIIQNIKSNNEESFLERNLNTITKRECGICYEPIEMGNLGITKCGHHSCYECLIKTHESTNKCPYCRRILYINDIYLVDDKIRTYLGPKIKQLISDLQENIKTIVYLENHHIDKLCLILNDHNIRYQILKGSMRHKHNLVRSFENDNNHFVLILSDPLLNYGIKNIKRIIILENWFTDIENKLKSIGQHVGNMGTQQVLQYVIKDTFEDGSCDF